MPRWPSHPIIVLSSLAVEVLRERIYLIDSVQAVNLLSGREMMRWQKLMCHPKIIFFSLSLASADSLFLASSLLVGLAHLGALVMRLHGLQAGRPLRILLNCLFLKCPT